MKTRDGSKTWLALAPALLAIAGCGGGSDDVPPAATNPTAGPVATTKLLSTRPDIVSGGDALVESSRPPGPMSRR